MAGRGRQAAVDPAALRSPRMVAFFGRVMARHMARRFHGVRVARPGVPTLPEDRPAVIYCNHPSWWDAAFLMVLQSAGFPGRHGFGPIDAAAIGQYGFMRRIGLFPIEPDTRSGAATFLRTATALLRDARTILWVTAEGHFTDPRRRPVRLRSGVAHLAAQLDRGVIVPLAIEYPFWTESAPEALAKFGAPIDIAEHPGLLADGWQGVLESRLEAEMDALAALSMERRADAFLPLLEGRSGVGGVYDLWRRAKAWTRGERFDPAHGDHRAADRPTTRPITGGPPR